MTQAPNARVNLQYESLDRLSGELAKVTDLLVALATPMVESMNTLPGPAFALVAESGDAYLAYRRRVGALNTETEAVEAELIAMGEVLQRTAKDFRRQSAETGAALQQAQRGLDRDPASPR